MKKQMLGVVSLMFLWGSLSAIAMPKIKYNDDGSSCYVAKVTQMKLVCAEASTLDKLEVAYEKRMNELNSEINEAFGVIESKSNLVLDEAEGKIKACREFVITYNICQ